MDKVKIVLVGQPNVGKSSLLNALVGPKVVISNYPGTTVEVTKVQKTFDGIEISFLDTPGIYSISDRSEEEKVTEKILFEEGIDGVIVVSDATALERSLYVLLQIMEAGIPAVIALNFVEDARSKGIKIDCKRLEQALGISVIPINPITKKGIDGLLKSLPRIKDKKVKFWVEYDDHIEEAISQISSKLKETRLPKRFISIRILEGDEDFYKYMGDEKILDSIKKKLSEKHPKIDRDIAVTRYGIASLLAEDATHIVHTVREGDMQEKVDRLLLHRSWGPIITMLILLVTFGVLLYLGNLLQSILTDLTSNFLSFLHITGNSMPDIVLTRSLAGLAAGISIALPYVFLFYLLLGLLEDIGVLSRFIVNAERFFGKFGMPGKAFIPLALGLGCSVPATKATRVLSSKREQFYAASFLSFVPCSSRTAIIMGVVGFYGGIRLVFYVFLTILLAALIWAFAIKRLYHVSREPLLLELPPYRKPLAGNILAKSWFRLKDFVYVVIPLLIVGGAVYGILDAYNITHVVVKPLSFVTSWLRLPDVTIIPLAFGFLQKDLTGAMLVSVLGSNISSVLTPIQIYTFGVASAIGIPCINAFAMLIREFGFKRAVSLTAVSIGYGILFAGLLLRIIFIF